MSRLYSEGIRNGDECPRRRHNLLLLQVVPTQELFIYIESQIWDPDQSSHFRLKYVDLKCPLRPFSQKYFPSFTLVIWRQGTEKRVKVIQNILSLTTTRMTIANRSYYCFFLGRNLHTVGMTTGSSSKEVETSLPGSIFFTLYCWYKTAQPKQLIKESI